MKNVLLFLDDERFPADSYASKFDAVFIIRTSFDAIQTFPNLVPFNVHISFDHDLGGNDTSMVFLNWLIDFPDFANMIRENRITWEIHSQNPIGAKNLSSKLESFANFVKEN